MTHDHPVPPPAESQPTEKLFGGGGVAGGVVDALGVDPAQVKRIVDNVEAITVSAKEIAETLSVLAAAARKHWGPLFGLPIDGAPPTP